MMRWLAVAVVMLTVFVGAGYANAVDEMEAVDALMLPPEDRALNGKPPISCSPAPSSGGLGCNKGS